MNGIINVYKEKGYTSFDVVAKLRGILKERKIGHTGTLDPDATGVLPVCVGKATKLCDMLTDKSKEYVAELLLGVTTDTLDMTGNVLSESPVNVTVDEVREVILGFVGTYDQIPPMYSALKVDGKKLYELARNGQEIERTARKVTIEEIEILSIELPVIKMRVSCSKGTYIRSLCDDIGRKLGTGGAMQSLVRTRVSNFCLKEARTLSQIEALRNAGELSKVLMPIDSVFMELPAVQVKENAERFLMNGNVLFVHQLKMQDGEGIKTMPQRVRVYDSKGKFAAIYQKKEDAYGPEKMFLGTE
ncbi:MAG: tRNA pseudouridine(55) synthase TruB [Lachnospiraceae bacterium]|nr:tRNA pseudouridine(55) synthase TruB [Lachnospiraceae bacterium]